MRYFDEMFNNKVGFNDGDSIPPDAEQTREVYIQAINAYAERLGSEYRLVAYDRFGVHNFYLILLYAKRDLDAAHIDPAAYHIHTEIPANPINLSEADEAMQEAVRTAYEMSLDAFILISIEIDEGLTGFLSDLREGKWAGET